MPDTKITALTAIGANPIIPSTFPIPMVDLTDTSMAASGTTKKVTVNQILGAGGTATLASATITGDLTVRTNVISATSSGVGFGINTAAAAVDVVSSFQWRSNTGGTDKLAIFSGGAGLIYLGSTTASALSFLYNGSEAMRLNSTGLGVGVSPSYKLQSVGIAAATSSTVNGSGGNLIGALLNSDDANSGVNPGVDLRRWTGTALNHGLTYIATNATGDTLFYNGTAASNTRATSLKMTLDASGNLLVKKTASSGTTLGVELLATGQINGAAANADNLNIYNTTAAAYRFYVSAAGTVFATNTTISAISDARFKENVQDIDVGLGAILALKPRKFDWKDGKGKNIKGDRGFIAQEFETVFPNLIDEWKENAPEGEVPYKSVRQDLIPVLVKAIQELAGRVQTLETR